MTKKSLKIIRSIRYLFSSESELDSLQFFKATFQDSLPALLPQRPTTSASPFPSGFLLCSVSDEDPQEVWGKQESELEVSISSTFPPTRLPWPGCDLSCYKVRAPIRGLLHNHPLHALRTWELVSLLIPSVLR